MKKALSLFIVVVLMMGVTIPGFAADQASQGTIGGGSTVDNAVLSVVLPTDLNFALNPLEIGTVGVTGSQIRTTDYMVINKTGAPVQVTFDLTAIPKDDSVKLVNDNSTLKKDDISVTDKNIYFAAIGATGVATGGVTFATSGTTAEFSYDKAKTETVVGLKVVTAEGADKGKAKGSIEFALGAATGNPIDTLAAANKGVAAFRFYGELNTYAPWAAQDISISGAYTLTALRSSTYEGFASSGYVADGLNQLKAATVVVEPTHDVKATAGGSVSYTVARNKFPSPGLKIYLPEKPASITSYTPGVAYTEGTDFTYNDQTGVITQTRISPSASSVAVVIVAGSKTYTVNLSIT